MINEINFQVKNFGPINEADMHLGKINVVGGYNATGKSTVSKLLYCILKASCNNRQDFAYDSMKGKIASIMGRISDDYISQRQFRSMDIIELLENYENVKKEYYLNANKQKFRNVEIMDNILSIIEKNDQSLYLSILKNLLKSEFSSRHFTGSFRLNGVMDDEKFDRSLDFANGSNIDFINSFGHCGVMNIHDVFYLESFSIFDLRRGLLRFEDYFTRSQYLQKILYDDESMVLFDDETNKEIISVEQKIEDIIEGKLCLDGRKLIFNSNNSQSFGMGNIASGIKQIGVVQLLLSNRKLKEGSVLIIDEPEVNLHPEWQERFAEILVLLAKDLNITLYLNSHSPLFIEAIRTYSEKYELLNDTNFYLTDESDINGKFDIIHISVDDLNIIYSVLGQPYEKLTGISIENEFKL